MKAILSWKSLWVICVYIISLGAVVTSLYLVGRTLISAGLSPIENLSYVYRNLITSDLPIITYTNEKVRKPFEGEEIEIAKHFYDMKADPKIQEQSLLLYANTYMPNTGILYSNKKVFDVLAVLDGTVEDITADEIMGNIVTIKHSNNLRTIYQSLNEVKVLVGDEIKQGDVIGNSGMNKIMTDSEFMLLFEVEHNGVNINPESFYQMDLKELS